MGGQLKKLERSRYVVFTVLLAAVTGIVDALLVTLNIGAARGAPYLPEYSALFVIAVWSAFIFVAAFVVTMPGVRKFAVAALILAGPGLLFISRAEGVFRNKLPISSVTIVGILLMLAAVMALLLQRVVRLDARCTRAQAALAVAGVVLFVVIGHAASAFPLVRGGRPANGDNIVLIVLDTTRFDAVDHMPNLQRFAARSVEFENAWSVSGWTLPSHLAMFTGVEPWTVDYDPSTFSYHYTGATLATQLRSRGYATGAIFGNSLLNPGTGFTYGFDSMRYSGQCGACRSGLAYLVQRLFIRLGRRNRFCDSMVASDVVHQAQAFVRTARRPYFLAINFMDSHAPYYVEPQCRGGNIGAYNTPAERQALFRGVAFRQPVARAVVASAERQYDTVSRCMDRSLGSLFDTIERQPDGDRTIVAVIGDHGEQFGEHGLLEHGNSVYRQVLHVPLVIHAPALVPRRVSEAVGTIDLHATLLDLAGAERAGRTLFNAHRAFCASQCGEFFSSVADERYHVITTDAKNREIFDYVADPAETKPLPPAGGPYLAKLLGAAEHQAQSARGTAATLKALPYLQ